MGCPTCQTEYDSEQCPRCAGTGDDPAIAVQSRKRKVAFQLWMLAFIWLVFGCWLLLASGLRHVELANKGRHLTVGQIISAFRDDDVETIRAKLAADPGWAKRNGVKTGKTPLELASCNGCIKVMTLLIKNGADVNAIDKGGDTPLHNAASYGHDNAVELLLNHGAIVDAKTNTNETPLLLASIGGQKGFDNLAAYQTNLSSFKIQDDDSYLRTAELLVAHGANINAVGKVYEGFTPLLFAIILNHQALAKFLIEHGADLNCKAFYNLTPLHLAAQLGEKEIVDCLLTHGANVNAVTEEGLTPLSMTAEGGPDSDKIFAQLKAHHFPVVHKDNPVYYSIAETLVLHGAAVNARTKTTTPLIISAKCNRLALVVFLVEHGADVNIKNKVNHSALYWAKRYKDPVMTKYLQAHGARE